MKKYVVVGKIQDCGFYQDFINETFTDMDKAFAYADEMGTMYPDVYFSVSMEGK